MVMMDMATIGKVDKIWDELGIGSFIPSPSLALQKLQVGDDSVVRFLF